MEDRNYTRLLIAIASFRLRYGSWPTVTRMHSMQIEEIQRLLTLESFARIEAKVRIIPTEEIAFAVEDDEGRVHDYCHEGGLEDAPYDEAKAWLGNPEWRGPTPEELDLYHRRIAELRQQFPGSDGYFILP